MQSRARRVCWGPSHGPARACIHAPDAAMTIGGVGAIQIGVGSGVCASFGSESFDGSGRVSVGPVWASTHVAGLQQGLIPGEPIGREGSQQPRCDCPAGTESVEDPHPPQPSEQPLSESAEQHVIAAVEPPAAVRHPVYDQPRKG